SNPDQGLSYSSSSISDQLKNQLRNSEALIILITADSLYSAWIPFEAGSFWTTDKPIIPILGPGLTQNDLPGPLRNFLTIPIDAKDSEDKLNNAINQLTDKLNIQQKVSKRRNDNLQEFSDALEAWQSKRSAIEQSAQRELEELKTRMQDLEQSYNNQLEETKKLEQAKVQIDQKLEDKEKFHQEKIKEIQAFFQQEKEKLEQNYKNQKHELDQALQSKISLQKEIEKLQRQQKARRIGGQINRRNFLKLAGLGSVGLVTTVVVSKIVKEKPIPHKSTLPTSIDKLDDFDFQTAIIDRNGKVVDRPIKKAKFFKQDLGNGVNLEMVYIPDGKFMMGSAEGEGKDNEKPQQEVTVPSFFMGKFEITQEQWKAIASLPKIKQDLEPNPSSFKGDKLPAENVSWDDAVEFCQRLSKLTKRKYRLPTEAEWEYACRAGTNTKYYFGETITGNLANYSTNKTTIVGKFTPNAFGLYDMHGNVGEWCQDNWHNDYISAPNDGSSWTFGDSNIKVVRGGSWNSNPINSRSASRDDYNRDGSLDTLGFRVVCVAPRAT
ncbi:MAG: SUMF1/EgtB/PvdO family nonheme iron enzyme, partial [Xenococcus sp. (in: cyanobacteria)]